MSSNNNIYYNKAELLNNQNGLKHECNKERSNGKPRFSAKAKDDPAHLSSYSGNGLLCYN